MKTYSITRRLVSVVLLVELVSALSVTAVALLYEHHEHLQSFDTMLRGRAESLLGAIEEAGDDEGNVALNPHEVSVPGADVYEVRDQDGRKLGSSDNWTGVDGGMWSGEREVFFKVPVHGESYRGIRLHGIRVVDDKPGGLARHVTIIYGSAIAPVWRALREAGEFFALANLLLLLATAVIMTSLLRREMAPLRELATEAGQVSVRSWRFDPPESARAAKELGPLVLALETLLGGLERSFTQQRVFLSDAAHELKTAVAIVKSSVQLLQVRPRSVVEYQAGLERCGRDCRRLEELVSKMLTLARFEHAASDEPAWSAQTSNLAECARQNVARFSTVAELREMSIDLRAPESLWVRLGEEGCALICGNLLGNALDHSEAGSTIRVSVAAPGDGFVDFTVEDQGEGIDDETLPHVFERFYRGDPSRSRHTGGTGLGLAICKAVVDTAGGEISIVSARGVGTTVRVRLPVAEKPALESEGMGEELSTAVEA